MLSGRFGEALQLAFELHRDQFRKGGEIPYMTHLMSVAALVGEHGGTEDQMIAALLHDAAEDQGGLETLQRIREVFGEEVAEMVEACSDTFESPKPPWGERKRRYIDAIAVHPPAQRLVSAADKVHNLRTIMADHARLGDALWDRFNASPEDMVWYYEAVWEALSRDWAHPILDTLRELVDELAERVG